MFDYFAMSYKDSDYNYCDRSCVLSQMHEFWC